MSAETRKISECKLCGSQSIQVKYDGRMRHSGVGSDETDEYRILRCDSCFLEWIDPFPLELGYEDGAYWNRKGVRSASDVVRIHTKALLENLLWLQKIGVEDLFGRTVIDFGCGTGAFLDLIKGIAGVTIGIERDPVLAAFARERGHHVYESLENARECRVKSDIIVSFDVFEHLREPVETLRNFKDMLVGEKILYIGVPNQKDKLKELVPAYLPHFFHVEHIYYFDQRSLSAVFERAGCRIDSIMFMHKYNFMNLVEWLRTEKAPGNPHSDAVDSDLDVRWRSWLEDRGTASHILLKADYGK